MSLLTKRAYDMAGVTPDSVRVVLNGRKVPITGFEQYTSMYMHGEDESLAAFGSFGPRWQVGVGMTDGQFKQVSFVNSICTSRGGQHVQHVQDQVTAHLHKAVNKGRSKGMEIKPYHISSYLAVYVNSLIENPAFDSQTKDTLTTRPSDFGSRCELPASFLKQSATPQRGGMRRHLVPPSARDGPTHSSSDALPPPPLSSLLPQWLPFRPQSRRAASWSACGGGHSSSRTSS